MVTTTRPFSGHFSAGFAIQKMQVMPISVLFCAALGWAGLAEQPRWLVSWRLCLALKKTA